MRDERLIAVCREYKNLPSRTLTRFCQGLTRELQLTSKDIQNTEITCCVDEIIMIRRKTIKAVQVKLRKLVISLAMRKGVIAIGRPIPNVGRWQDDPRLLEAIGSTNLFNSRRVDGHGGLKPLDPLTNSEFIDMLI